MLDFITWNIDPVAFSVAGLEIKWYGVMWALSILSIYIGCIWFCRIENRDENKMITLVQYIFIGALVGARLGQVFFYDFEYFSQNPLKVFAVRDGGLASHGGLIGVVIAIYLFCRANKDFTLIDVLDRAAIVCFIPGMLIRLGNLFNSELIGKPTNVSWAFQFVKVDDLPRHPSVLYEAIMCFVCFWISLLLYKRFLKQYPGLCFAFFLIVPWIIRFLLEFEKVPDGNLVFGFISITQTLNFIPIAFGLLLLPFVWNRKIIALNKLVGE